MKKFMQKRLKNEKGMTLIELLAVIVILAIIAAIAIPAIGNIIDNSRHNAVKADFQNVLNAGNLYFAEANSPVGATFVNTATEATNKYDPADYIQDPGSVKTYTVTKTNTGSTIEGTFEVGGKTFTMPSRTKQVLDDMKPADIEALTEVK